LALGPLPPAGEERDSGGRTMGVTSSVSTSVEKNFGSRTSPPSRRGTGLRQRDDGGGLKHLAMAEKKCGCRTYTPHLRSILAKWTAFRQLIVADGFGPHAGALLADLRGQASSVNRTRLVNREPIVDFIATPSAINCASGAWWHVTARRHRAWLHISRTARHTDDRSSIASTLASAVGPILPGQARRSDAA
jgi:hypothetical protein